MELQKEKDSRMPAVVSGENDPLKIHRARFDNITQIFDYASAGNLFVSNVNHVHSAYRTMDSKESWSNNRSMNDLSRELVHPDLGMMEKIDSMLRELDKLEVPPLTNRRRRLRRLEDGDEIDPDLFLARDPEMWERMHLISIQNKVVKIAVNTAANAAVSQAEFYWRGAAVLALSSFLAARGYSPEISITQYAKHPTSAVEHSMVSVVVKHADHPLDMESLLLPVCSIAWMRLVSLRCCIAPFPGRADSGLGWPAYMPEQDRKQFDYVMDAHFTTREQVLNWLNEICATFCGKQEVGELSVAGAFMKDFYSEAGDQQP